MAKRIITGLDIGTSAIRAAVCVYEKNDPNCYLLAITEEESRGMRHGYVINPEETVDSIKKVLRKAEKTAGVKLRNISLSIGGITLASQVADGSVAVSRADSEVTDLDLARASEAAHSNLKDAVNREIIHTIAQAYRLDSKKVLGRPLGLKGSVLEAKSLFITVLEQHASVLVTAVEEAGVSVCDVIAAPIAASFAVLSKREKTAGCVLINIGAETLSLAVFEEGIPISIAVFPIGSLDITNDIAIGMRVSLEEAELLKQGLHEPPSKKKLDEIMAARLSDIFDTIKGHLKKIGRLGLLPAGAIFTGGGAFLPILETLAREELALPVRVVRDFIVPVFSREDRQMSAKSISSLWSVAYGLTLAVQDEDIEQSTGAKIARSTKKNIIAWLRELLP